MNLGLNQLDWRNEEIEKDFTKLLKENYDSLVVGLGNQIIPLDQKISKITGYKKNKLKEMTLLDFFHPREKSKIKKLERQCLTKNIPETLEASIRTKNDRIQQAEIFATDIEHQGKKAILLAIKEKEQSKTREELVKIHKKIIEESNDPIVVIDKEMRFLLSNKEFKKQLGIKKDLTGKKIDSVFSKETIKEKIRSNLKECLENEGIRKQISFETREGKELCYDIQYCPLDLGDNREAVTLILRDITKKRKKTEQNEFFHSLLRHDIKGKAQVIMGYLELLKGTELTKKQQKLVKKALKASKNEVNTTEKVKTLTKLEKEKETREIDLDSIIKETVQEYQSLADKNKIEIERDECEFKVKAGNFLRELFSNLIENAIRHSDGNKIKISSREKQDFYIVIIEDDGKGIPDEEKDRIFERGFTKGKTSSSGLGMYIVKKVLEMYNGKIEVKDSELGGARFEIYLKKP